MRHVVPGFLFIRVDPGARHSHPWSILGSSDCRINKANDAYRYNTAFQDYLVVIMSTLSSIRHRKKVVVENLTSARAVRSNEGGIIGESQVDSMNPDSDGSSQELTTTHGHPKIASTVF
jgi:hypothetical protein